MSNQSNSKSQRRAILFIVLAILISLIIVYFLMQQGTYDLKGKWSITINGKGDSRTPLTLYISTIEPALGGKTGQLYATGCLASMGGLVMPFDMQASAGEDGEYSVTIISTARMEADQPEVLKMMGLLQAPMKRPIFSGKGTGSGTLVSEQLQTGWQAVFQSDQTISCELSSLPEGIYYYVNMSVHYFYEGDELKLFHSNFGVETNIAHTAAKVETPHGVLVMLEPETDIFSPQVDFINAFRLDYNLFEDPLPNKPYLFTLYNALNEPIPGTTVEDLWGGCAIDPTRKLSASFTDDEQKVIKVSWDAIPVGPGWDPDKGIGIYQLLLINTASGEMVYGSEMQRNEHIIPWESFEEESPGLPDGLDYGQALSELPDGNYHIWINAQVHTTAGISIDCVVRDEAAIIHLVKSSDKISIIE